MAGKAKMARNCWKWLNRLKIAGTGWKQIETAGMTENGLTWLEIDRFAGNGWKQLAMT